LQFVDLSFGCVGFDGTAREDDIADRVDAGIRTSGVNEFAMIRTLFTNKQICNLATCGEAGG